MEYKKYTKKQMINIIKKEGFLFVETNLGEHFVIRQNDMPDFIMLESERTGHKADMTFYMPGIDEPVATTMGCFLNQINPLLRQAIIKRLVLLQQNKSIPNKVKIFDNKLFTDLSPKEMGIENNKVKNFNKLYLKYVQAQNTYNEKMEGE